MKKFLTSIVLFFLCASWAEAQNYTLKIRGGINDEGLNVMRMAGEDGLEAIRYLRAHADEYGIDKSRVAFWGTSSGGNTALLVALTGDDPRYKTDFAAWQRTCARLWTPLLEEAGCQVIITAHQHRYRYDAPDATRSWAHIVGGGPSLGYTVTKEGEKKDDPAHFPTVIEGSVHRRKLRIKVHNALTGKVIDSFDYAPRK